MVVTRKARLARQVEKFIRTQGYEFEQKDIATVYRTAQQNRRTIQQYYSIVQYNHTAKQDRCTAKPNRRNTKLGTVPFDDIAVSFGNTTALLNEIAALSNKSTALLDEAL